MLSPLQSGTAKRSRGSEHIGWIDEGCAWSRVIVIILALLLTGCGGGGGGGSSSSSEASGGGTSQLFDLDPAVDFFLAEAHFARLILDPDGLPDLAHPLVNPASLVKFDPVTSVLLPGYPKTLHEGADLYSLEAIDFDQMSDPLTPQIALVPRNAALVLSFTQPVDADSLATAGTLGVLDNDGALQSLQLLLDPTDPRRVIVTGVTPQTNGWPASPLKYDGLGTAVQDSSGQLSLTLTNQLLDSQGQSLLLPKNHPGSAAKPLLFQPGNSLLDAIVLQTDDAVLGFNGFLPDLDPPRIVRSITVAGTITALSALSVDDDTQVVLPSAAANAGLGEWAGARLDVTSALPGGASTTTSYIVASNSDNGVTLTYQLALDTPLEPVVSLGDSYVVRRSEYFEPIAGLLPSDPEQLAAITVDPADHPRDPFDPHDANNSDLRYFMTVLDEDGNERLDVWNPATHTFLPLPPRSSLKITFGEPMEPSSFAAYESFAVSNGDLAQDDAGFQDMRVGRLVLGADGFSATFEPVLEDQLDPDASQFIGFGGTSSRHRLVLRTRPEPAAIADVLASAKPVHKDQMVDLDVTGVVGITDLGGRGLALPAALLDQSDSDNYLLADSSPGRGAFPPAIDFAIPFETIGSDDPDFGVVVHRFMGLAKTGIIAYQGVGPHDTVTQGIEYHDYPPQDQDQDGWIDRRFLYGPTLLEVGLSDPGRLTGASAANIEHLIDNFNAPKPGVFANPNGEDFLVSMGFGVSMPLDSGFGARFQHVYRASDASPSYYEYRDSVLDLVGLAWAPSGGQISNTTLDDMQILVGLSGINGGEGPNTNQTNGIPSMKDSGLRDQFDCNLLEWAENCGIMPKITNKQLKRARERQPEQTTVVLPGTSYTIDNAKLFVPANATGGPSSFNQYLDFASFNGGIDPTFDRDDVHSFPYDSNFPMLIEYRIERNQGPLASSNRFGFSPGILSSTMPRFRVWSQAQDPLAHSVPNWSTNVFPKLAAANPEKWFRAGEGGPFINPLTLTGPVLAPQPNNGMPDIPVPPLGYIIPPVAENGSPGQPVPDWQAGKIDKNLISNSFGCITQFPVPNSDPLTNTYFANGMFMYPLPAKTPYPGPNGAPPTQWIGYGVPAMAVGAPPGFNCIIPPALGGSNQPGVASNEPGMSSSPAIFGDNSRYYMMWKYSKRVSLVESPTIPVNTPSGKLRWHRPIIEPPLSTVGPDADLRLELKAGTLLDYAIPTLDSDYVDSQIADFVSRVNGSAENRRFVKFRASFGVAKGQLKPPALDTVILPYEKLKP
jgi:hypothetical protein